MNNTERKRVYIERKHRTHAITMMVASRGTVIYCLFNLYICATENTNKFWQFICTRKDNKHHV